MTPVFQQYRALKEKYQNHVLFFRLGDFYELFDEDAKNYHHILQVTLTQRQGVPMCGVPHHSKKIYINKLLQIGKSVALAEQISQNYKNFKEILQRDVVRIITPGTIFEEEDLDFGSNHFLGAIFWGKNSVGISFVDLSTGRVDFSSFVQSENQEENLLNILCAYNPKEMLLSTTLPQKSCLREFLQERSIYLNLFPLLLYQLDFAEKKILEIYKVSSLRALGLLDPDPNCIHSLSGVLQHVQETQKTIPHHLKIPQQIQSSKEMLLDRITLRSLEIVENSQKNSQNTLLTILDKTQTGPGKRLLKSFLIKPSLDLEEINTRLNCVEFLFSSLAKRDQLSSICKEIRDVERLCSKISLRKISPREMGGLQKSMQFCLQLLQLWKSWGLVPPKVNIPILSEQEMVLIQVNASKIQSLLLESPGNDFEKGGYINPSCHTELQKWITLQKKSSTLLIDLLEKEKQQTNIQNLKIRFIQNTGYFFEVNKSGLSKIPDRFIKKRTLLGSERFTTAELLQLQEEILSANEKSVQIERELFENLIDDLQKIIPLLQKISDLCAKLDVFNSLATVAFEKNYTKPILCDDNQILTIQEGRHPIIEACADFFISNDLQMNSSQYLYIITGANMSGKSTFLRQNALIILMAQIGSFVPAKHALIGLTDQIFTRIGASDNLSKGESTFLVEMSEISHILKKATAKSFVILDEVGRGTSTYDGLCIAWAILEHLVQNPLLQCRTIFATHHHELSKLESFHGIKNFYFPLILQKDSLIFARKIRPGSINQSYGIQVAKMAGLPQTILDRSHQLLENIEKSEDI